MDTRATPRTKLLYRRMGSIRCDCYRKQQRSTGGGALERRCRHSRIRTIVPNRLGQNPCNGYWQQSHTRSGRYFRQASYAGRRFRIFVEEDSGASVLTINPDADEKQERVVRLPPSLLKPEMFIILRSTGGSDYIVTMADKLLGSAAASCRRQQQDWKDRLRTLVLDSSLLEVSVKLLDAGSTSRAYETNVRNWISSRNIRPHSYEDFSAIMRIIGIPDKAEEYWRSMEHIARHHQRAGQQIRRLLLRKLRSMDLTNLRRLGRLDIALPDADAGTLTAFRVMAIEPITRLIPAGHLNHPFHYGGAYAADAAV